MALSAAAVDDRTEPDQIAFRMKFPEKNPPVPQPEQRHRAGFAPAERVDQDHRADRQSDAVVFRGNGSQCADAGAGQFGSETFR